MMTDEDSQICDGDMLLEKVANLVLDENIVKKYDEPIPHDEEDQFLYREIQVINEVPENAIYEPGLVIGLGAVVRDNASDTYKALHRIACEIYTEKSLVCSIYPTNVLEIEYSMINQGVYKVEAVSLSLPDNVNYETVQVYHFDRHIEIHGDYKQEQSCSDVTNKEHFLKIQDGPPRSDLLSQMENSSSVEPPSRE